VAGVNVDGNPSMNPTAVSAAEDRFRDRFHSAFETIHFAIVSDLPLSGRTKFAVPLNARVGEGNMAGSIHRKNPFVADRGIN
jgi:hypothetical protein